MAVPHLGVFLDSDLKNSDFPIFLKLLGESKSIVSSFSILQADLYYHNGVMDTDHHHDEHIALSEEQEDLHDEIKKPQEISRLNFLPYIAESLTITDHVHLTEDQTKEIIPWLVYSTKIDPHNIQGYTLTAYYLAYKFGKPQDALNLLKQGIKNNPKAWEIYAELGGIYFNVFKDFKLSKKYFEKAWRLLQKTEYDKFQTRHILTLLASSNEKLGKNDIAINLYEQLHALFPKSAYYRKKILLLENIQKKREATEPL